MEREAWLVIVHRIAMSWTLLRDFQFTVRLPLRYPCPALLPGSVYISVSTCICMCIFVSSPMPSEEAELGVKEEGISRSSQVTLWLSFLALNKTDILPLVAWQMCGCAQTEWLAYIKSLWRLFSGVGRRYLPLCTSGGGFSISSQDRKEDSSW